MDLRLPRHGTIRNDTESTNTGIILNCPAHEPSIFFEDGVIGHAATTHKRTPPDHSLPANRAAVHDGKILYPGITRNGAAVHDSIRANINRSVHLGLAADPAAPVRMLRIPLSAPAGIASRFPEVVVVAFGFPVHHLYHVRVTVDAVVELVPKNRLHLGGGGGHGEPEGLVGGLRFDGDITRRIQHQFAVARCAVGTFGHQPHGPLARRIGQSIRCIVAPLVMFTLVRILVVAKTLVAFPLLVLDNPAEPDSHLPCRIRVNAHNVVAPALRSPITRHNVTVRPTRGRIHPIQHRHAHVPCRIGSVPACREFVVPPRLAVELFLFGSILERRILHRKLSELAVQIFQSPTVHHHHRSKGSLLHAAVLTIVDRFHPEAIHFLGTVIAATELFLEVFQKLPVAVAVARGTVIKIREVDEVFGAMGVLRVVLVRHPVGMRLGEPTRMAVIAHPTRNTLQTVRKFVRRAPIILQGPHTNPHARPVLAVQILDIIEPAVKRRHHGIFKNIDVALEFLVWAFGERQHPSKRIRVERENLLQ